MLLKKFFEVNGMVVRRLHNFETGVAGGAVKKAEPAPVATGGSQTPERVGRAR